MKNRFVSAAAEKFEPGVALFGGEDGLELYKKMFQQMAEKKLKFETMIGEFGFGQREKMEELLEDYALVELMKENEGEEILSINEAKAHYEQLEKPL